MNNTSNLSLSISDLPKTGLYPDDPNVAVRPPPIAKDIFKRVNSKSKASSSAATKGQKAKDTNRWIQPVKDIGRYVREHNEKHKNEPRLQYRWWGNEYTEDQLTDVLIGIVESKAHLRIPELYGTLTYEQAQRKEPKTMESFVIEVAMDPMFDPLTQTARAFGVRTLISSKMTTKRRSTLARTKREMKELAESTAGVQDPEDYVANVGPNTTVGVAGDGTRGLAPSTVPDLGNISKERQNSSFSPRQSALGGGRSANTGFNQTKTHPKSVRLNPLVRPASRPQARAQTRKIVKPKAAAAAPTVSKSYEGKVKRVSHGLGMQSKRSGSLSSRANTSPVDLEDMDTSQHKRSSASSFRTTDRARRPIFPEEDSDEIDKVSTDEAQDDSEDEMEKKLAALQKEQEELRQMMMKRRANSAGGPMLKKHRK